MSHGFQLFSGPTGTQFERLRLKCQPQIEIAPSRQALSTGMTATQIADCCAAKGFQNHPLTRRAWGLHLRLWGQHALIRISWPQSSKLSGLKQVAFLLWASRLLICRMDSPLGLVRGWNGLSGHSGLLGLARSQPLGGQLWVGNLLLLLSIHPCIWTSASLMGMRPELPMGVQALCKSIFHRRC